MANVQVIQRHAHLAGPVRLETVNGREGPISKATLTAISNTRRGSGEHREEESTAVFWTLVVGLGIVLPLFIQSLAVRHRIAHTRVAPVLVLLGGLALRFVIVYAGQHSHWPRV